MKKYIVTIGIVVGLLLLVYTGSAPKQVSTTVLVSRNVFNVIHADTEALREKGLSGRTGLPKDTIMLFSFPKPAVYGFWMKDMLFPIDILWTDRTGNKVLHIERNVATSTYPTVLYPPGASLYVLEASAHVFNTVQIGDKIKVK